MRMIDQGATGQDVLIRFGDNADGTPELSVTAATPGLILSYRRQFGADTTFSATNLAALTTAWSVGGLKHIRGGLYRVDAPDAAFSASADWVVILAEATSMVCTPAEIQLTAPVNVAGGRVQSDMRAINGETTAAATFRLFTTLLNSSTGAINSNTFEAGAITDSALGAACITAAKFAPDAITSSVVADAFITAAKFAADAITNSVVANSFISAAKINTGAITAGKFAADAITSSVVADNFISAAKLATGAITAAKFAADAITSSVVATGFITAAKFAADAITNSVVANSFISAAKINTGAITASKFAADAIDSSVIAASAVTKINVGQATNADVSLAAISLTLDIAALSVYATSNLAVALDTNADLSVVASRVPALSANGYVQANIKEVNDVLIQGDGAGTPWQPV